jgi:flagellar motor switch protein FliG
MAETDISVPSAAKRLKRTEKAAALLLAVGKDEAARLLTHFGEGEIRAIARSASDLGAIPQSALEDIADEFMNQLALGGGLRGSAGQVEELLEKILPPQQVRQIMFDVRFTWNREFSRRVIIQSAQQLS